MKIHQETRWRLVVDTVGEPVFVIQRKELWFWPTILSSHAEDEPLWRSAKLVIFKAMGYWLTPSNLTDKECARCPGNSQQLQQQNSVKHKPTFPHCHCFASPDLEEVEKSVHQASEPKTTERVFCWESFFFKTNGAVAATCAFSISCAARMLF